MKHAARFLMFGACLLALACEETVGPRQPAFDLPPVDTTLPALPATAIPDSLVRRYWNDAGILAVRHLATQDSLHKQPVEIPVDLLHEIYNALGAIHGSSNAGRDSAIVKYRIHAFPSPNTRFISVYVDTTYAWTTGWRNGRRATGIAEIDSMLRQHDLELISFSRYFGLQMFGANFRSTRPLNIAGLRPRFEAVEGVQFTGGGYCCDSNDMHATRSADGTWNISFELAWGDCPAGCTESHYWDFSVTPSGSVSYLGWHGDPIPAELLNITGAADIPRRE